MRKIDRHKPITGMATKTINFEKIILQKLEQKAAQEETTVSKIVNFFCRTLILSDVEYYRTMQKHYYLKMQESQFMKENAEIKLEIRQ